MRSFDFDQLDLQKTGIAAASAASALFVAAALISVLQRRKQLNAESLYKAFCEHMAARGITKATHESPTIFLERIKQTLPKEELHNVEEFLHYYSHYCYAGHNDNEQASFTRLKNILYRIQHEQ